MLFPDREYNELLRARLSRVVPNFLKIRSEMGVGNAVGFGFLPNSNLHPFSIATLPPVVRNVDGRFKYGVPAFMRVDYRELLPEHIQNIIVEPEPRTNELWIVSIFQRREDQSPDPQLLTAPDNVFEGFIAHELAHLVGDDVEPPTFVSAFRQYRGYLTEALCTESGNVYDPQRFFREFDNTDEAVFDVIAGMLGYKDQVIAKLQYTRKHLQTFSSANDSSYTLIKPAGKAIEEIDVRIAEVLRYCP